MRTHVTILGALHLVCGLVILAWAGAVFVCFSLLGAFVGAQDAPDAGLGQATLQAVGALGSGVLGVTGLVLSISGGGLLARKSWARILGIVVCAVSLIEMPFGTGLGVYGLWVLFHKETERLFARPDALSGTTAN